MKLVIVGGGVRVRVISEDEEWTVKKLEEEFSDILEGLEEAVSTEEDIIICDAQRIKDRNWKLKGRPIVRSNSGIAMYKDCNKMSIIRVLDTLLEDIHSSGTVVTDKELRTSAIYTLHIDYFAEKYGYTDKLYAYQVAKESIIELNSQIAAYKDGLDDTIYLSRLIDTIGFNDRTLALTVKFTETGYNLVVRRTHKKGMFMRYSSNTSLTESTVKYKLMVYLQQYAYKKIVKIPLPKLRQIVESETKYTTWQDFKVYVLEPAIQELKDNVGLVVEYKTERVGRSIYGLEFIYDI